MINCKYQNEQKCVQALIYIFVDCLEDYWDISVVRLYAIENENVDDEDIVVTVDSNLFVMSKDILDFLDQYSNMTVWVPKYHDTLNGTGPDATFNQNLIAMKAKMWKKITGYEGKLNDLIHKYRLFIHFCFE